MFSSMRILFLLGLASRVYGNCDPTNSTTTACPAIPAMPSSVTYSLSPTNTQDFTYQMATGISQSGSGGLLFSLAKQGDAPTMITNDYLLYGNVKATIKSATGVGMVSAFILMSDVLDEIDLEWLGAYDDEVQTNYFYRGETASYDRGASSTVTTPEETEHVYELDWTSTAITWSVDGTALRTLTAAAATAAGYGFPSTPCQIRIGVWASGDPTNAAGTIEWGGGLIDYAAGPYNMTLSSLSVESYTQAESFVYNVGGTSFSISQDAVSSAASSGAAAAATTTTTTKPSSVKASGTTLSSTTSKAGKSASSSLAASSDTSTQVVVVAAVAAVQSSSSSSALSSATASSVTKSAAIQSVPPTSLMAIVATLALTWFGHFLL